jgi:hypothetical protein
MRASPTFLDFSQEYRKHRKLPGDTERIVALVGKHICLGFFLFSEYLHDPCLNPAEVRYLRKSGFKNPNDACVRYFLIKYFKAKKGAGYQIKETALKNTKFYYKKYANKLTKRIHQYYTDNHYTLRLVTTTKEYQLRVFYEGIERGFIPKTLIEAPPNKYYLRFNLTYHLYLDKPFKNQTEASFSGWGIMGFTGSEILVAQKEPVKLPKTKTKPWKDFK